MGNSVACSACCTDLSRQLPLANVGLSEAYFSEADLPDQDAVAVASRGAETWTSGGPDAAGRGHYQTAGTKTTTTTTTLAAESSSTSELNTGRQSDDSGDQYSAAASDSTAASTTPDMGKAQHVVKNFVRTFVKGRSVSVLTVNGSTTECIASLDRKLTTLSLQRSGKKDAKKRGVPLHSITEVCVGLEAGDEIDLPLDDLCVTLLLEDGNAVGFKLNDIEDRDTFALCLSMFIDGRRGEMERKAKKEKV